MPFNGCVRLGMVLALCASLGISAAEGNGEEFFDAKDMQLDMYYFGHIKDVDGKVLDNLIITITARNAELRFPFRNDAPGHFRSPDVGRAIKGLGKSIDPSQIEIVVTKKGYAMAAPIKIPTKTTGAVGPLSIVLVPTGN